jgi:hypothetical protein
MANNTSTAKAAAQPQNGAMGVIAPLAGWFIPGLGHIIQKRYVRGGLIFISVSVMFFCGIGMQGKVYGFNLGDLLDMLNFLGDFSNGLLYFLARSMEWGSGNIFRATADYGTKFLACGGLLNLIAAIDAHHIAIGKKQ